MDRFIAGRNLALGYCIKHLKSNMDRFIELDCINICLCSQQFKIQYG